MTFFNPRVGILRRQRRVANNRPPAQPALDAGRSADCSQLYALLFYAARCKHSALRAPCSQRFTPKSWSNRPTLMHEASINCAVQGFTLTGGMTAENKDTDAGRGGAVRGGGFRSQLLDCIVISNRAGRAGGAYAVWAQRCRIVNNTSSSISILRGGCLASSCLFYGNTASGSDIAGDSYAFGCTGYENNFAKHLNSTTCGYNSVFNGGIEDASGGDDVKYERAGCFVGASSATQPGVRVDVAPFTNPAQGDFSIRRCSTAWRSGGVTGFPNRSGYFAFFTTDDIDGRPFVLSNGTVLPGAVQQVGPSGNGLILLFR